MPGYIRNMNMVKNNNHLRHAVGKGKKRLLTPQRLGIFFFDDLSVNV